MRKWVFLHTLSCGVWAERRWAHEEDTLCGYDNDRVGSAENPVTHMDTVRLVRTLSRAIPPWSGCREEQDLKSLTHLRAPVALATRQTDTPSKIKLIKGSPEPTILPGSGVIRPITRREYKTATRHMTMRGNIRADPSGFVFSVFT